MSFLATCSVQWRASGHRERTGLASGQKRKKGRTYAWTSKGRTPGFGVLPLCTEA